MAAGELEACQQVSAALDRCRRAIWEMAATRVAALLTSPAAPETPNLLRLLGIARRFAAAGEAFSGVEATALRQHIARAGDAYFAVRSSRQHALCSLTWIAFPVSALWTELMAEVVH